VKADFFKHFAGEILALGTTLIVSRLFVALPYRRKIFSPALSIAICKFGNITFDLRQA
jgi:DNA mismatch repair ATPase MutL